MQEQKIIECRLCGEGFEVKVRARGAPRKYCSPECSREWHRRDHNARYEARLVPCSVCERRCRPGAIGVAPTCSKCEANRASPRRLFACIRCGQERYNPNPGPNPKRCPECKKAVWREHTRASRSRHGRELHLRKNYGITIDEFDALLRSQNGRCAICSVRLERGGSKAVAACVDHCHDSGTIRGILCGHCNTGIGLFRDDPMRLAAAREYLLRANGATHKTQADEGAKEGHQKEERSAIGAVAPRTRRAASAPGATSSGRG